MYTHLPPTGQPLSVKEALVLRLNAQYPGDVGVLSAFFLNLVGGCVFVCVCALCECARSSVCVCV